MTPNDLILVVGGMVEVTATYQNSDGTTSPAANATWAVSNPAVAMVTVAGGGHATVRGLTIGTTVLTVAGDGATATVAINVRPAVVRSIAITPTAPSVAAGISVQLTATATFTDMTTVDVTAMAEWSSSASGTATVDANGMLRGVAVGTTTITARFATISGTTTATVTAALLRTIQVTPTAPDLPLGLTQQLKATGTFSDNTEQDLTAQVTWSSGAEGRATVSAAGVVTAVGVGAATITASMGPISGSTTVTVTSAVLLSIAITPPTPSVARGRKLQLVATGTFSDTSTRDLTGEVTWASGTPAAATIDAAGLVTAVDPGTTTISASLSGIAGTTLLTVTAAALETIGVTPPSPSIALGRTQQFAATGTFSDATVQDLTDQVLWTSSDIAVAEVSNAAGSRGLATTLHVGSTTVSATLDGITGSSQLTVTDAVLDSIAVTPTNPSLALGRSLQLKATGTFSNGTTQDLTTQATWASDQPDIATVSTADGSRGLALALRVGAATVSATVGTVTGSTVLTVTAAALDSIAVTPTDPSVPLGRTKQFAAIGTFSDLSIQDLTLAVTWESTDAAVATISNADGSRGLAKTEQVGSTTIRATLDGITGSTTLTVTAAVLDAIQVAPVNPSAARGTDIAFLATGVFSNATTQDLTTQVAWTSSDITVATISNATGSQGVATAENPGTATIRAELDGVSGETTLTVTDAVLVSIQITPIAPSLALGRGLAFLATGTFTDDTTQDLTLQVTWASSDEAVARISNAVGSKGVATSISVGPTTISAAFGGITGETTLTVTPAVLESIAVTAATTSIAKGRALQFTAIGTFSDATQQDLTTQVTWLSADIAVAQVSNDEPTQGLATATGVGATTISATLLGVTGSAPLTVTDAELDAIAVAPADASVIQGLTRQLAATGTFSDGTTQDLTTQVLWASSNDAVAQISNAVGSAGLVSALTPGTITITATLLGVTGSTTLTVTAAVLESIAVTPANTVVVEGHTRQFTATGSFNNGLTQNLTTQVTWASSNEAAAQISNASGTAGQATTLAAGSTTISATLTGVTGSTTLTVIAAANHLVINEVDYDQLGTDTTEYVEIYNPTSAPISLANLTLVLVNGAGTPSVTYATVDLVGASQPSLGSHQYLILGPAAVLATVPDTAVKLDTGWLNIVQNGSPDGVALIDNTAHTLIDALSYEGSILMATLPGFAGPVSLVEGTALPATVADSNTVVGSLCRSPDGIDADNAATDWTFCSILTPGAVNP